MGYLKKGRGLNYLKGTVWTSGTRVFVSGRLNSCHASTNIFLNSWSLPCRETDWRSDEKLDSLALHITGLSSKPSSQCCVPSQIKSKERHCPAVRHGQGSVSGHSLPIFSNLTAEKRKKALMLWYFRYWQIWDNSSKIQIVKLKKQTYDNPVFLDGRA